MPLYTIPCSPDGDQSWSQTMELDGRSFRLRFMWSQREDALYLDIRGSDGTLLAAGLKLAEAVDVLRRRASALLPPGPLTLIDMTLAHEEPTYEGLGTRWLLFYGEP